MLQFSFFLVVFISTIEPKVCFTFTSHEPLMILTPDHQIHAKEGQSLQVNCSVKDSAHAEKWQIPYWKAQGKVFGIVPQNRMSYNTVTLFFQRIHKSDAGIYKCIYNTTNNVITRNLVIIVDARSSTGAKCRSNEFICEGSSQCIALDYRCNNVPDCEDGSDEFNCIKGLCVNKFRCLNGKCIDQELVCDEQHKDHCGDASDEYCQLLSLTDQKKDTANTTIDATKTQHDHMTWLKTTLYVVIGCTVSVVFLISVIVVAVFRIRMKRNAVRRTYQSERSSRNHREHDSSPVNYQAADPFLNMAPSANYGNIIVNVNNGIQYVPGAEFSEFAIMEAPPSYSDVEQEIFEIQNIPPPDYSTIDRNPLRVNGVSNPARPHMSGQSTTAGSRQNRPSNEARPRTQNAAVQTLTHRSQRSRSQPGTESLPRQPNLNVRGGEILLSNSSASQPAQAADGEIVVQGGQILLSNSSASQPAQAADGEILVQGGQILLSNNPRPVSINAGTSDTEVVVSSRPPSAVLQIQNGQIMLSNPDLHVDESEQQSSRLSSIGPVNIDSGNCIENCQNTSESDPLLGNSNPQINEEVISGQGNLLQNPRSSFLENDHSVCNIENQLQCSDNNPQSNIQVSDGQIFLADGSSPSVISGVSSGAQGMGHIDVFEGQIVFK